MIDPDPIRQRFAMLSQHLHERSRRLLVVVKALTCGHGGIAAVSRATGASASMIGRGLRELAGEATVALGRVGGWWLQTFGGHRR
jgi:hypothetical protein